MLLLKLGQVPPVEQETLNKGKNTINGHRDFPGIYCKLKNS